LLVAALQRDVEMPFALALRDRLRSLEERLQKRKADAK